MTLNRPAIITTAAMLFVCAVFYLAASNERAMETCMQTQSYDTCAHLMR